LLDIDLNGIVDLTRRVGARMIERGRGGKIHMIGSFVVQIGVTNVSVYAATKGPSRV
jgi:short-subunit dehydrogenase